MKKIVINRSRGDFDVSTEGFNFLIEKKGWKVEKLPELDGDFDKVESDIFDLGEAGYDFVNPDLESIELRTHPDIIEMVEVLEANVNAENSNLIVIEIPEETIPIILNMRGFEYVVDQMHVWPSGEQFKMNFDSADCLED